MQMDTTGYMSHGNAAYDLSAFAPGKPREKTEIKMVTPSKSKSVSPQIGMVLKFIFIAGIVLCVLAASLSGRAILTELNVQIDTTQKQLERSISENTVLQTRVESKTSMRAIEQYATENLGMTPLSKDQIVYVNLSGGDKIELNEGASGANGKLRDFIELVKAYFIK